MKMIDSDLSLTKLFKMFEKLQDEIAILKVQIENLQDTAVRYYEFEPYRCQCAG